MRATQTTSDIDSVRSRCSALSDLSSTAFAVLRLSSFTMTSPSFVFTTTRSPLCTVAPGDTIVWVNKDLVPHTATSKTGGFDSKGIEADESWSYTIRKTGDCAYICTFHPTMKAMLRVKE